MGARATRALRREGDPFLVFRAGDGAQRLVTLGAQRTRICIGRSPGNDVALEWDTEVPACTPSSSARATSGR